MRDAPRGIPSGVLPLAQAAVLDLGFVLAVLQADRGPGRSPWLGVPATLLALTLPLLLLLTVLVAVTGPTAGRLTTWRLSTWQAATVAMAGVGFAAYLSPWGRAGVAVILET